jgi:hypothetical protein
MIMTREQLRQQLIHTTMTRLEELNEAWCKQMNKCSTEIMQALAFALRWCEEHPQWISVEDELPPRFPLNPNESMNVITYGLHTMVNWYDYERGEWVRDSEITHWMPMPQEPLPQAPKGGGRSPELESQDWMRL